MCSAGRASSTSDKSCSDPQKRKEDKKTGYADAEMRMGVWEVQMRHKFPNLTVAALRILGLHPTSCASERNWSAWRAMYRHNRLRLSRVKVCQPMSHCRRARAAEAYCMDAVVGLNRL